MYWAKQDVCRLFLNQNQGQGRQQVRAQANDAEIRLSDSSDGLQEHWNGLTVDDNLSRGFHRARSLSETKDVGCVAIHSLLSQIAEPGFPLVRGREHDPGGYESLETRRSWCRWSDGFAITRGSVF